MVKVTPGKILMVDESVTSGFVFKDIPGDMGDVDLLCCHLLNHSERLNECHHLGEPLLSDGFSFLSGISFEGSFILVADLLFGSSLDSASFAQNPGEQKNLSISLNFFLFLITSFLLVITVSDNVPHDLVGSLFSNHLKVKTVK